MSAVQPAPFGEHVITDAEASLTLALLDRHDATDLAPMLGLADDDEPRLVYDPIYRTQRARPRPRATHTGRRAGQ